MPLLQWVKSNSFFRTLGALIGTLILVALAMFVLNYSGITRLFRTILIALIPLFFAVALSAMVEPVIYFLSRHRIKRFWAVILTYFGLVVVILMMGFVMVPMLVDQLTAFIVNLPDLLNTLYNRFLIIFDGYLGVFDFHQIINDWMLSFTQDSLRELTNFIQALTTVLLAFVGAIFLSFDFQHLKSVVKNHLPLVIKEPIIRYFNRLIPLIYRYLLGLLFDSTLLWIFSVVIFALFGFEYAIVFALFVAIANFVPVIGNIIGGIPIILYRFSLSIESGITAILIIFVIQFIESNFLQPTIMKNSISLHPVENIFGVILFGSLFGLLGMIIAPILITAIKIAIFPSTVAARNETSSPPLIKGKNLDI